MASTDVETAVSGLPDYLLDSNAVLKDTSAKWRYGRAPDYSKTREVFNETKSMSHEAESLPSLVENLVKNWEVEASFKSDISDWRTIDHPNYTFSINGGPSQSAKHMLEVGTYNAIIAPNEYYSPTKSDFASSHKTFKRMMPTFAWEVLEVYSGPPVVAFRWRHWGTMKSDYVGFNDKGETVTAKAHGGQIDIQGVTVAKVDDKVRLQSVETWFDPMEMFRQIAPTGAVSKVPQSTQLHRDFEDEHEKINLEGPSGEDAVPSVHVGEEQLAAEELAEAIPGNSKETSSGKAPLAENVELKTTSSAGEGPAVKTVVAPDSASARPSSTKPDSTLVDETVKTISTEEAVDTHKEMSKMTPAGCPFLRKE